MASLQSLIYNPAANGGGGLPRLQVLDQLLLPHDKVYLEVKTTEDAWQVHTYEILGQGGSQSRGCPLAAAFSGNPKTPCHMPFTFLFLFPCSTIAISSNPLGSLYEDESKAFVLDFSGEYLTFPSHASSCLQVIRRMNVRGAPLIGIVAALGLAVDLVQHKGKGSFSTVQDMLAFIKKGAEHLKTSRPTAVNLFLAMDDIWAAAEEEVGTRPPPPSPPSPLA